MGPQLALRPTPPGSAPGLVWLSATPHPEALLETLRILIVDDHPLYRMGLVSALQVVMPEADVTGAGTAQEGVAELDAAPDIDLVLLDLRLPGMDGLAALAIYGKRHPDVPRVLISGEDDERLVHKAFGAGASGFIPKSLPMDEVAAAIRQVLSGGVFVPTRRAPTAAAETGVLTLRQLEVLRLLGEGYTNKEIAQSLEITERTARAHVAAILQSLDADNRTHAVVAAQRLGWLARKA